VQTIVHGTMKELVKWQLRTDISQLYSGAVQMDARGMNLLVPLQLLQGICQFYSGAVQTIVHGMK